MQSTKRIGAHALQAPATKTLNMSTGPVEVTPRVRKAQDVGSFNPHQEPFWQYHDETVALLGKTMRTKSRVFMMHGSIRAGLDMALFNLIRQGTRVLCLQNGYWSQMIGDWAEARGAKVTRLSFNGLAPVDPETVRSALNKDHYDIVTMTQVETNGGMLNPTQEVGEIVSKTDALFLLDTACSVGAVELQTDEWNVDVSSTGAHKCLGGIPGLAIVTFSDKAWRYMEKLPVQAGYFNAKTWWRQTMDRNFEVSFTPPAQLVMALRESLLEINEIGLEDYWQLHKEVADEVLDRFAQMDIHHIMDKGPAANQRQAYSNTVLAMALPGSMEVESFRLRLLENYGIFVGGNISEQRGTSFRLGLMTFAQMDRVNLYGTLGCMEEVIRQG
ncbi:MULTISPECIES: aminotransferase class V-fold PLP-dependent enzyme [unclassified Mesorhizobium]|uniref:pyridoxal-phosphate-dependent aminotransferase family protein n=1 Tax=unclassified Mesorhizobium TaxID=325217 RepID=UPI00112D3CF3|nr:MULTISPECIES: aminotransferase class V-fold PLP-dependent enzyme [unclassified Mesorhizobium]TPL00763.1 alanine--glyoxylate aminotransferase family protein [Mesorhizobium sp. B2-4-16]TPL76976.1 alanine--glyoxylate aminotransferase family protein [Mesorhizobium sp. B2-4-3]